MWNLYDHMNIFFLSWNPRTAAEYHCDKHVVKMIIECAQLLYSAHWVIGSPLPSTAYKLAHRNHPCSIWTRLSLANYLWLASLGWWLCREYEFRYLKIHKTEAHILWLLNNHPAIGSIPFTNPPLAMPDEYKCSNVIKSYRTFYIESKCKQRNIVKYKCRTPPSFLIPYVQ
jgi:hypothetical protein